MLYRPDFCCSCGEKVDRIEWHVWTSRRFCELCQTEHQFDEWLPRILGAFFLLLGLTGVGSLLRAEQPDIAGDPVGEALRRAGAHRPLSSNEAAVIQVPAAAEPPAVQAPLPTTTGEVGRERRPVRIAEEEPVYFCGAVTKKGTPCSRKVKGGGRCWQHKGAETPALPKSNSEGGIRDQIPPSD